MNCLSGDIFSLEIAIFDSFGDFREMKRLVVFGQNNVDLVTDILRVNCWPLDKSPIIF
ncbi:hypothetical protein D3C87_1773830 [compost metagenome]